MNVGQRDHPERYGSTHTPGDKAQESREPSSPTPLEYSMELQCPWSWVPTSWKVLSLTQPTEHYHTHLREHPVQEAHV
jgi:hypothetical protein